MLVVAVGLVLALPELDSIFDVSTCIIVAILLDNDDV